MKFSKWTGAMNSSKNPWTSPEITQIWLERGIPEAHSDKSLMPVVQKSYLGLLYSTETWTHSPRLGDLKHQLELYTSHDFMCTIIRWYWLTVKIWILHRMRYLTYFDLKEVNYRFVFFKPSSRSILPVWFVFFVDEMHL